MRPRDERRSVLVRSGTRLMCVIGSGFIAGTVLLYWQALASYRLEVQPRAAASAPQASALTGRRAAVDGGSPRPAAAVSSSSPAASAFQRRNGRPQGSRTAHDDWPPLHDRPLPLPGPGF